MQAWTVIPLQVRIAVAICICVACFLAGARLERMAWQSKAAKAVVTERKQTVQAETIADESRKQAQNDAQKVASATTTVVETIRYVYKTIPAACPDARPVPDSVRDIITDAEKALAASR